MQIVSGRALLLFSCRPDEIAGPRRPGARRSGTWTVLGSSTSGGWTVADGWNVATARPFAHPSLYGARLVAGRDGGWYLIGFRHTEHGVFHGEILDPIPVDLVRDRLVTTGPST